MPRSTSKKTILIVEDEKPMARALCLKLGGAGFATAVAYNGEETAAILGKEKFDLILLDLVMPIKDGFAVLEEMKRQGQKIPVIVLTNLSQQEDLERAHKLGARDAFVKSDTPIAEVVEKVKKILGIK